MRVLLLSSDPGIPLFGPSGASSHLRGVARALVRAGHDVRVVTPALADHRGLVHDPVGARIEQLGRRHRRLPRRLREASEWLDSRSLAELALRDGWRPDLVWERHALFSDGGRRLAARLGVRRILEVNAPLLVERTSFGAVRNTWLGARLERRDLLAEETRVITVSAWLARWARELGARDVRHVPNGLDPAPPGDRAATRERLGLTGLVVGFLGTMKPWHGAHRIPSFLDRLPGATGLVVGEGPEPPPPHPRLRLLGAVAPRSVPDIVAAMDVAVAPYLSSAPPWFCPLKILAYRAEGVPVVAPDVGDCRSLIGQAGEIVGSDDPGEWAAAIHRAAGLARSPVARTWDHVVREALSDAAEEHGQGGLVHGAGHREA